MDLNEIIGQRFGKLTVLKRVRKTNSHIYYCLCQCDCGEQKEVRIDHLRRGDTTSCGCDSPLHHGTGTRLFRIWCDMRQRCSPQNKERYKHWSGKGITICKEWKDYKVFRDWAISNGYQDNLTIDRIDNDGNYEPSNCRWATYKEQGLNKSNLHHVTIYGETHTVTEWCELLGLNRNSVYNRMKRKGWSIEKAITEPYIKPKGVEHPYLIQLKKANMKDKKQNGAEGTKKEHNPEQ